LAIPRFLLGRLLASFSTAHRQLHASEYADLHDWKAMGAIQGFLLPYLGQDDSKLPAGDGERVEPLGDLAGYPVDFSPMPEDATRGLVDRGRSLTHRLLQSYGADLKPPPSGQYLRIQDAHH
jgi:NTE family protein